MRIQFEIKENLPEITAGLLHSEKWLTLIKEERDDYKKLTIKDPYFDSAASVEIFKDEIRIQTAWSNYSYRIYKLGDAVWCEYVGAYRGLLEQNLLPVLTPKKSILGSTVLNSSLLGNEPHTLQQYSKENMKLKTFRRDNFEKETELTSPKDHPKVVYDEFIKMDMPLPPLENKKNK
ncbi:hypothetical protein [Parabacteroides sp. Marseille-P3160]|uniref:hypothetical protein n=1 Tax=Parabacteroides sp. Marseille-P3160 TaxID=1917887 RepID=UPI0009B9D14B|nr:hypothetical protein [Parabacteroides sp. Marseille-P3160]